MTPSPKSLAEELRALAALLVPWPKRVDYEEAESIGKRLLALAARAEREENFLEAAKEHVQQILPDNSISHHGHTTSERLKAAYLALTPEDSER